MNETRQSGRVRAIMHERWLTSGHGVFVERLQDLEKQSSFWFNRKLLMLLTLEPLLMEALRRAWNNLPSGSMRELHLYLKPLRDEPDCMDPPDEEALLATATELAHIVSSSLSRLCLSHATVSITSLFLTACSTV